MEAIHLQKGLAFIFFSLGGWCLIDPMTIEKLVIRPEFYVGNSTTALFIGCFGAQAVLGSVVMWSSLFRPSTFLIFGIVGSVPFFVFNYYFYFEAKIFTEWMLLDFVGNTAILACGLLGYRLAKSEVNNLNQQDPRKSGASA